MGRITAIIIYDAIICLLLLSISLPLIFKLLTKISYYNAKLQQQYQQLEDNINN